jgi:hypothetical protein
LILRGIVCGLGSIGSGGVFRISSSRSFRGLLVRLGVVSMESWFVFLGSNVTRLIFGISGFTLELDISNKSTERINSVVDSLTATIGQIDMVRTADRFTVAHLLAAMVIVFVIDSIRELVRSNRSGLLLLLIFDLIYN